MTSRLEGHFLELIRLSWPMVLSNAAWSLIGIVDTAFMGRLGRTELAAIGLIYALDYTLMMVLFALGSAVQILIARWMGAQQAKRVNITFWNGVWLLTTIGLFITIAGWWGIRHLLPLGIENQTVLQVVWQYMDIKLLGYPLTGLFIALRALFVGSAYTFPFGVAAVIISVANAILDYALIFGIRDWLPAMGVQGAALASVLAIALGVAVLSSWAYAQRQLLHMSVPVRFMQYIQRLIIYIGFPLVAQGITAVVGWLIFFLLIEKLGREALAVSSAGASLLQLLGLFTWSLAPIAQTIVSNLLGQGRWRSVFIVIGRLVSLSTGSMLIIVLLLNLFPEFFWRLYTQDAEIIALGLTLLPAMNFILLTFSVSTILFNSLAGTGRTTYSWISELIAVAAYVLYAYLVVVVIPQPIQIVWFSEGIYWLTLALVSSWFLFIRRGWLRHWVTLHR